MQNTGIELLFEGNNLLRILEGTLNTIQIAFISIFLGLIFGLIFGIIYSSKNKTVRLICRLYLEIFRIIPILVWLFVFYFIVPKFFNRLEIKRIVCLLFDSFYIFFISNIP